MNSGEELGASVRLVDVFAKQIEMGAQLAVIQEQLRAIPDHEARLRVLEGSRARLLGAAMALSGIVSAGGTWIGLLITRH